MARDYKGFGNQSMNGVIEWKQQEVYTHDLGVIMADVNVIGSLEAKFESTNRIDEVGGGAVQH